MQPGRGTESDLPEQVQLRSSQRRALLWCPAWPWPRAAGRGLGRPCCGAEAPFHGRQSVTREAAPQVHRLRFFLPMFWIRETDGGAVLQLSPLESGTCVHRVICTDRRPVLGRLLAWHLGQNLLWEQWKPCGPLSSLLLGSQPLPVSWPTKHQETFLQGFLGNKAAPRPAVAHLIHRAPVQSKRAVGCSASCCAGTMGD